MAIAIWLNSLKGSKSRDKEHKVSMETKTEKRKRETNSKDEGQDGGYDRKGKRYKRKGCHDYGTTMETAKSKSNNKRGSTGMDDSSYETDQNNDQDADTGQVGGKRQVSIDACCEVSSLSNMHGKVEANGICNQCTCTKWPTQHAQWNYNNVHITECSRCSGNRQE